MYHLVRGWKQLHFLVTVFQLIRLMLSPAVSNVDSFVRCLLQKGWPFRQTQLSETIVFDCYLFRECIVAKTVRKLAADRFDSEMVGPVENELATNCATGTLSDETTSNGQPSTCVICKNPLRRLMGPPLAGCIFLHKCLARINFSNTEPSWLSIRRNARPYVIIVARVCMCGARYDNLYRKSYIDGYRALLGLWLHILSFL